MREARVSVALVSERVSGSVWILALLLSGGASSAAAITTLSEDMGNFPDAVSIEARFGSFTNLQINGDSITGTGFHVQVANTSWGDGSSSSFAADPDGDFAEDDILLPAAAAAFASVQSFGLFAFGAGLPAGAGVLTSAPAGFAVEIEGNGPGAVEVNFAVDLSLAADGLLFDGAASIIDPIFLHPRTGTLDFFISTTSANLLANLLAEDDGLPALDVSTSLAWAQAGAVATVFDAFDQERLRPRGELVSLLPEPSGLGLVGIGLAAGLLWRSQQSGPRARSPEGD